MPMILYLHGVSHKGDDYRNSNNLVLGYGFGYEINDRNKEFDAIIVMPQVPKGQAIYDYPDSFIELVKKLATNLKANEKKISVFGFSHGCYGLTRSFLKKNDNFFSAAVAVGCPNQYNPEKNIDKTKRNASRFKSTPLWTLVGESKGSEGSVMHEHYYKRTLQYFSNQVEYYGGKSQHTGINGKPHNIVNKTYSILRDKTIVSKEKLTVVEWMLSKSR